MGDIILNYESKQDLIDFIIDVELGREDKEELEKLDNKLNNMYFHEVLEYGENNGWLHTTEKQMRLC